LSGTATYSQATLLADIGQSEILGDNAYSELTTGVDRMFFIGFKNELWTSRPNADGSETTTLVIRLDSVSNLTIVGPFLYFIGDDGVSGPELWRTDAATGSSPVKVKDIRVGAEGSNIQWMTNVNGTVYFSANDGEHGQELWRSSGDASNTVMIKDIIPGSGSSVPSSLTDVEGTVFFAAEDPVYGNELWKSSGTAAGTVMVKDIRTEPGLGSAPNQFENVEGTLFFAALESGVGRELWRSDGTPEGTWLVKDILTGSGDSGIENTTAVDGTLFFSATDGIHGHELWKSDGTESGTVLVKDLTPGSQGSQGDSPGVSFIGNFANMYGTLFFTAVLEHTPYIWKSDGTLAGTVPLHVTWGKDPTSAPQPDFVGIENNVYFVQRPEPGYYNDGGYAIYSMNLNGEIQQFLQWFDVFTLHEPYNPEITEGGGHLYMLGRPYYTGGFKIVRSSCCFEEFVTIDIDPRTVGSNPSAFVRHNDLVYFIADHPYYQQDDLWVTDGTPEGTRELFGFGSEILETEVTGNLLYSSAVYGADIYKTELNTGITNNFLIIYDHDPAHLLTGVNDSLYFVTAGGTLWKSNGTSTGTRIIREFNSIRTMDALKGTLLFRVIHADGTEELWRSGASTSLVKTLHTGMAANAASYPTATIGNTHYFVANDGIHGNELWKSKGTASTTSMVIDINTNESANAVEDDIRTFVVFKNALFFSAMKSDGSWALYKTHGTAGSTQKVIDVGPVVYAVTQGDQLYFFTEEPIDGSGGKVTALWKTDGTLKGTTRIYDFETTIGKIHHTFVDEWLYFTLSEGSPLWRTDGTTCSTTMVDTGTQGAYPIEAINSTLIFGSYTSEMGQEPYAFDTNQIPSAPCTAESTATLATEDTGILSYPNPFTNEFAIRIAGDNDELARIRVMTLAGHRIEEIEELRLNTDHVIGQSWAPGVYLIRVEMRNKVKTQMVVKR
jgi:ELWxxDGT repeat protein